jgi:hypothetical protein
MQEVGVLNISGEEGNRIVELTPLGRAVFTLLKE